MTDCCFWPGAAVKGLPVCEKSVQCVVLRLFVFLFMYVNVVYEKVSSLFKLATSQLSMTFWLCIFIG